jgi:hypothetical protein
MHSFEESRRRFLLALLASPVALALLPYLGGRDEAAAAEACSRPPARKPPTPECADDDDLTPSETAGPFFKPRSPERVVLSRRGFPGRRSS